MTRRGKVVAYLGLGSNQGDSRWHLEKAIAEIDALPETRVLRESPQFGSKPWGKPDQPDYVNAVVEIETALAPHDLLAAAKALEQAHGRIDGARWGPRPLDIDILVFGEMEIREPGLEVPHPRMWERAFVLRPLAALCPRLAGPDGRTVVERLRDDDIAGQATWPLT
jgi:2-amino-4-hydroxy-6-hydroxymethyldihydropteridine diphosphokinase